MNAATMLRSYFRPLRLAVILLALGAPAIAHATLLTLINHTVISAEEGWNDTYRNDKSYSIRVTLRYREGNDSAGQTYTADTTLTLPPGSQITTWDHHWPEDNPPTWDRQEILTEVALIPPAITSAGMKSATQGQATSYAITAANVPTSFGASGLPPGLSVNTATGVISGSPAGAGSYTSTITATNTYGTGSLTLTWTIAPVADSVAPSVPAGLQSNAVSYVSFTLNWSAATDNVGVTAYEVRRDSTTLGTAATTAYNLTGLTQGTSYSMTVRARDYAGNWSAWSAPFVVTTPADAIPPSVPTGLQTSGRTGNAFNLSWSASTDNGILAGYDVRRHDGTIVAVTDTALAVSGLQPLTTYAISVRARDVCGNVSDWSAPLNVATTGGGLTLVGQETSSSDPQGWQKTWRNTGTGTVRITFEHSERQNDHDDFLETYVDLIAPGGQCLEFDWFEGDQGGDWHAESQIILAHEIVGVPVIGGVLSPKVAVGLPMSYAITAFNAAASFSVTGLPAGLSLNTTTGVISGTPTTTGTYNVTIRATNGSGTGQATLVLAVITDTTPPSVPTGLVACGAAAGYYNVRWNAATDDVGVTAYEVRQDGLLMGTVTTPSIDLPTGMPNQSRAVSVRARDASGNWSAWSNPLSSPIRSITVHNGTCATVCSVAGATVGVVANTAPSGKYFAGWTITGPGALDSSAHPGAKVTLGQGSVTLRAVFQDGYKVTVPEGCFASAYGGPAGAAIAVTAPEPPPGQAFNGWDVRGAAELERASDRVSASTKLISGDVTLTPWYLWNAANGRVQMQTGTYVTSGSGTPGKIGVGEALSVMALSLDDKRPLTWQRIETSVDLGRTWQLAADIAAPNISNADYSAPPVYLYIADSRRTVTFTTPGRTLIRTASFDGTIASMWAYTSVEVVPGPTIIPYAAITKQPQNQAVLVGESVTFRVAITGPPEYPNFTYRWRKASGQNYATVTDIVDVPTTNGRGISGATTATLTLTGLQLEDNNARYFALIMDGRCSYLSSQALLTVAAAEVPPAIDAPPESLSRNVGQLARFSVTVSGVPTPSIEWRKAGALIPGETGTDLQLASVTLADAGLYTVKVGGGPTAKSASASLSVSDPNAPSAPANLQVVATTATTVALSWSAPASSASTIVAYAIYRDGAPTPIAIVGVQPGAPLTFLDSARTPGSSHAYSVTAISTSGSESPRSASISGSTTNGATQTDTGNTTTRLNVHIPLP